MSFWRWLLGQDDDRAKTAQMERSETERRENERRETERRAEVRRLSDRLVTAEERVQQAAQAREAEVAVLRATIEEREQEVSRLTGELEEARRTDSRALEEMLAQVDREREQLRANEAERETARAKLMAELSEERARKGQLQLELEKMRAALSQADAELQHVNSERKRLLTEYGQVCSDMSALRQSAADAERWKAEAERLRAQAGGGKGGRKGGGQVLANDLARRDVEITALHEQVARLEKELAQRGSLLPLADLPLPLQQMVAQVGSSADAQRLISELWDRLIEQESRFNAAREDTNKKVAELETLRIQLSEICAGLITPLTVLSANSELLAMRQDMPPAVLTTLEEMRPTMTAVRQAISRLQKLGQKMSSPEA